MKSKIPSSFEAVAKTKRVVDPQLEWERLCEHARADEEITQERWIRWLTNAKIFPPEAAPPKMFKEPDDWREARERSAEWRDQNIAAAKNILAMLEGMSPTPEAKVISKAKHDPEVDPLCACGRLAASGPGSSCGKCLLDRGTTAPLIEVFVTQASPLALSAIVEEDPFDGLEIE